MFYKSQHALVALPAQMSSNYRLDLDPVTLALSRYLTAQQMPTNSASSLEELSSGTTSQHQ